jgi:glycyl-tRNA synthetase beta chain
MTLTSLAVPALLQTAFGSFTGLPSGTDGARADLTHFIEDRLVGLLREQGYSAQEVDAVVALHPERWGDIPRRLAAVRAFGALPLRMMGAGVAVTGLLLAVA